MKEKERQEALLASMTPSEKKKYLKKQREEAQKAEAEQKDKKKPVDPDPHGIQLVEVIPLNWLP